MAGLTWREGGFVLSENKVVRLFSFFLLYLGQGLPLGVSVIAFPAWLVMNGAPEADVAAVIATAYLPWSFKFIPAAVMDRFAFLAMGRRRAWLIVAQFLMVAGFVIAAVAAPGPDDLQLIVYIVFLIGAGSAIQDVAVDGLAVDILSEEDQGTASSFMFAGQTVGRSLAAIGAALGLEYYGSQITFLGFLPVILLITLYVVFLRERPGERLLPWTAGQASQVNLERHVGAWWPMAKTAFWSLIKVNSLKLLGATLLSRCAGGMLSPLWPIVAVGMIGFSTAGYASMISTVDLLMALASIVVGSYLTTRIGPRRSAVLVMLAFIALSMFILYGQSLWITTGAFIALTCLASLFTVLESITTNPLRMQLSDPTVAATQFTIYNSLANLPVALGAWLFAEIGGTSALDTLLWTTSGLFAAGALVFGWMSLGGRPEPAKTEPAQTVAAKLEPVVN